MTDLPIRRLLIAASLALALPAFAQIAWPTQPVKVLVGFPGGSTPDIAIRTIADALAKALGQPIIIDNRVGASGNIAADAVAKATDDHTLGVVINGNLTTSKTLNPQLGFDPEKDFTYLSLLTTAPLILVTTPDQPSGAAFFDAARKGGNRWSFGSVGNGSVAHVGMEALKATAGGITAVHVPYRGNPQVLTALLAGEIQMALIPPGVAMPQVQAGKLKAVGVTSAGHNPLVPDLAPLSEAGVKNFELEVWTALVGPARLSKAAVDRLTVEVPKLLKDPEMRQKLFAVGWNAVGTSPEGMKQRVEQERKTMEGLVAAGRVTRE